MNLPSLRVESSDRNPFDEAGVEPAIRRPASPAAPVRRHSDGGSVRLPMKEDAETPADNPAPNRVIRRG